MNLDPTKMKDWQIAEAAEETIGVCGRISNFEVQYSSFNIRSRALESSQSEGKGLAFELPADAPSRLQHERNYDDARLAKSNLKRIDIDLERVGML